MAIRPLNKAEANTLLIKLALAGYIPERDFKIDDKGRIWARKEDFTFLKRIPALPEPDIDVANDEQPAPIYAV